MFYFFVLLALFFSGNVGSDTVDKLADGKIGDTTTGVGRNTIGKLAYEILSYVYQL